MEICSKKYLQVLRVQMLQAIQQVPDSQVSHRMRRQCFPGSMMERLEK